jgi:hypothetical protein
MTNEERIEILQMVENGEVSVADAIGLMSSPPAEEPDQVKATVPTPKSTGSQRWLRVRVTNLDTGRRKVSVNLPLGLMKWGLSLGTHFAPELDGIDFDELITDIDQYAEGFLVEVEDTDGNERVEVYIE